MIGNRIIPSEIFSTFQNQPEWQVFFDKNKFINDEKYIKALVKVIKKKGIFFEPENCQIKPRHISISGKNYRETIVYGGIASRHRAILHLLYGHQDFKDTDNIKIYCPEALSPFAKLLKEKYNHYVGSEYSDEPERIKWLNDRNIPVENLLELSYSNGEFDSVIVNDIFEHLPDLPLALREIHRVLKPNGRLLSTFPFAINSSETIVKAQLVDNQVEYLTEPEYHRDPINPAGVLVFQIPGWDVLDAAKAAGFQKAQMVLISSPQLGIVANHLSGVMVLECFA